MGLVDNGGGICKKNNGWPSRVAAGRGRCHIVWLCVFFVCLFLLFGLCLCWFVYTPVCFFGWSWAQHPNLHFVGGAGLITLTNTFLVELGSAPWYRLGPTPQLPCSLAPSMRGQALWQRRPRQQRLFCRTSPVFPPPPMLI